MIVLNGIFQRRCNMFLPYNCIKSLRTIFSGGYNKFFHDKSSFGVACKVGNCLEFWVSELRFSVPILNY